MTKREPNPDQPSASRHLCESSRRRAISGKHFLTPRVFALPASFKPQPESLSERSTKAISQCSLLIGQLSAVQDDRVSVLSPIRYQYKIWYDKNCQKGSIIAEHSVDVHETRSMNNPSSNRPPRTMWSRTSSARTRSLCRDPDESPLSRLFPREWRSRSRRALGPRQRKRQRTCFERC